MKDKNAIPIALSWMLSSLLTGEHKEYSEFEQGAYTPKVEATYEDADKVFDRITKRRAKNG